MAMIKIIPRITTFAVAVVVLASPLAWRASFAEDHSQMHHEQDAEPAKKAKAKSKKPAHGTKSISYNNMPGMERARMDHGAGHEGHEMKGFLGPYGMGREGSGTSWQPDISPHQGIHAQYGDWMTMYHAMFNGVYNNQGGPRGDSKTFASGMVMGMAQHQTESGTVGLRAMVSPDPFMGPSGYPNLLATGETADGRTHLIDRQHPHDLFMELAGTYSYQFAKTSSVYLYAGLPGETALGPTAFMHRTSGMDKTVAPIT